MTGGTLIIPFVGQNNDIGLTTFDLIILKDGVIYTNLATAPVYTEVGQGLYTVTVQFTETGTYTFYVEGAIAASVLVKARSVDSYLANIEDATMGSWQWNKQTKTLTLYKVSGGVLATYNMDDTDSVSSKEKV